MNKEALRKELEDACKFGYNKPRGRTIDSKVEPLHLNAINEYINSRLAALDDGGGLVAPIKTGLKDKNGKEICEGDIVDAPYHLGTPETVIWGHPYNAAFCVGNTLLGVIDYTDIEVIKSKPKPLDDGQEGKGLPNFLVVKDSDDHYFIWPKNRYEKYVSEAVEVGATPAVKIVVGFNGDEDFLFPKPLPVADGEGEKRDGMRELFKLVWLDGFHGVARDMENDLTRRLALLPSAVTGGVKDAVGFINWAMDNNYQCKLKNITGGYEWYIDDEDGVPVDYLSPEQLYQVYLSEGQPAQE